jgi:hypothetical protein
MFFFFLCFFSTLAWVIIIHLPRQPAKARRGSFGQLVILFYFYLRNLILQKAHFAGLDERVKPWLSQALTRDARPDSNSRSAVQISNLLPSRYAASEPNNQSLLTWKSTTTRD